ncbi:hypothetical protein, partial [Leptospira interrogans]|uniref:hypothetical protein n=1 Tax=Leptospira interrogans TaxID=173 RepID=UPI003D04A5E5
VAVKIFLITDLVRDMYVARISFVSNINSIKIVFANLYIFSVLKSTSTLKNLSIAVYMLLMNLSLPKTKH